MGSTKVIAVVAFFALALFGSGTFLHGTKIVPAVKKETRKSLPATHHGKSKAAAIAMAAPGTGQRNIGQGSIGQGSIGQGSIGQEAGQENTLAFPLMVAGGVGLLVSALAALSLSRSLSAGSRASAGRPASALPQASSQQPPARFAGRMREAERLTRAKQQEELAAQQATLQAEKAEAARRQAETEALREQVSRQFQEFFRTLPVPCFCFAASGKIIRWNAACEALYGIPAAEALDSTLWETIVPDSEREEAEAGIRRVLAGQSLLGIERWDRRAGGVLTRLRCSMVPLHDTEGQIIGGLSAGVDITEYARQEEHTAALEEKAAALTAALEAAQAAAAQDKAPVFVPEPQPEIAGHPAFRARLAEEVERAARYNVTLSLILLDLDGFSARNRTLGFESGDLALQSAVGVIKSKMRTVDVIARLGADDYAVILPETGEAGARIAMERLRAGLGGGPVPQTACFGAAQLAPTMSGADDLVCHALAALTSARSCGANTAVHFQDLPQKTSRQKARQ